MDEHYAARPRTPWASTPIRRPCASWGCPSTTPGLGTAALLDDELPDAAPPLLPAPPQTVVRGRERRGTIFEHRTDPDLIRPGSVEPGAASATSPAAASNED